MGTPGLLAGLALVGAGDTLGLGKVWARAARQRSAHRLLDVIGTQAMTGAGIPGTVWGSFRSLG